MCNINLMLSKKRNPSRVISDYMNYASWNSWKSNHDGEGFFGFIGDRCVSKKSLSKLKYNQEYWFLSTHQRFTTSGQGIDNAHPHITEHLILQHNGVFRELSEGGKSDTNVYAGMLEEEYVKCEKNLVKAIQNISAKIYGSYSIVVYEKETGKVYYYKDTATSMYLLRTKKWIVMSTKKENLEFAQFLLGCNKKIGEVNSGLIIDVLDNFKVVAQFEEKKAPAVIYHYGYPQTYFGGARSRANNLYRYDKEVRIGVEEKIEDGLCNWSGMKDYLF